MTNQYSETSHPPIPYIFSPTTETFTFVHNGESFTASKGSHSNYEAIKEALKAQRYDEVENLLNISKALRKYSSGRVTIKNGQVYYDDEPVHNTISTRILNFMEEGLPCEPMIKFLENLMENPSRNSIEQLYTFLEHKGLPITEDGCFLGYKGVRKDFFDKYSGKFLNAVGKTLSVPRNTVDDNFNNECSHGLHVGCLEYASNYAGYDGQLVVVKVNPKNCVAVPQDHNFQKLRTCEYEVVALHDKPLEESPLYNSSAAPLWRDDFSFSEDLDWDESENDYEDDAVEDQGDDACQCQYCTDVRNNK